MQEFGKMHYAQKGRDSLQLLYLLEKCALE
jgi:hypothetical protein